ncbi:MAG: carboxypeptidase regulatory-like domain-containing protein, partial [Deltaproteobacteria bacterium]|nr:carboxypeptidase regulatory-like domain-containing protein [Deltaproteobacteria bacterium]
MLALRFSALLVLLSFSAVVPVEASVNGTVSGVVKDSSGALVPQAEVKIINVDTNVSQTVHPNAAAAYSFLSLPVGHYRLEVHAQG